MKNANVSRTAKPRGAPPLALTTILDQTGIDAGPSRDEVAAKAYFMYLDQGCPQGRDLQHWFEAEAQVIAARNVSRRHISAGM